MRDIKQNWMKWIMWLVVAASLFWGGLAMRLNVTKPSYKTGMAVLLMFLGIILFGTLLVTFVLKHLKQPTKLPKDTPPDPPDPPSNDISKPKN